MKLYSREYQAERNHHIVLVYDTGRLMGERLALEDINAGFDRLASGQSLRDIVVME